MLVLSRRVGEEIVIADHIRVRIASVRGKQVRLAIAAPESVPIRRLEIQLAREEMGCEAAPRTSLLGDTLRSKRKLKRTELRLAAS